MSGVPHDHPPEGPTMRAFAWLTIGLAFVIAVYLVHCPIVLYHCVLFRRACCTGEHADQNWQSWSLMQLVSRDT